MKQSRNGVKDFKTSKSKQAEWISIERLGIVSLNVAETDGCTELAKHH